MNHRHRRRMRLLNVMIMAVVIRDILMCSVVINMAVVRITVVSAVTSAGEWRQPLEDAIRTCVLILAVWADVPAAAAARMIAGG
jgi:hypothetical protein